MVLPFWGFSPKVGQGGRGSFLVWQRWLQTASLLAVSRQVGGTRTSAVCAFSLKDIEKVFEGKYKELDKETSRWTTYEYPDISPRPGSVSIIHATEQSPPPPDT